MKMEERSLVPDGAPFKGQSYPEPDYRKLPGWVVWHLAANGWGRGLIPDDRADGKCAWCQKGGADYRGCNVKLCVRCAMQLGFHLPWYVPVCRRCYHPMMPGAAMGVWCSPSNNDPRLCLGCEAGWLRLGTDDFCRALILDGAADGARLLAQLLLERGQDRACVIASTETSLWGNSYLFEALRLGRVSVERLVAQVHQIALEIIEDFEKSIDMIASRDRQ
jgi:hypothetical protein